MRYSIKRGDIVDVDLAGAVGVEKMNASHGSRPCIVVQNDTANRRSPMTIVAPLAGPASYKGLPVQVRVSAEELGAGGRECIVECGHLRTIDVKSRIKKHLGSVSKAVLPRIDEAIAISLGLRR